MEKLIDKQRVVQYMNGRLLRNNVLKFYFLSDVVWTYCSRRPSISDIHSSNWLAKYRLFK